MSDCITIYLYMLKIYKCISFMQQEFSIAFDIAGALKVQGPKQSFTATFKKEESDSTTTTYSTKATSTTTSTYQASCYCPAGIPQGVSQTTVRLL